MSNEEMMKKPPLVDGFENTEEGVEGDNNAGLPSTQRVIQGDRLAFSNDFVWLVGDEEFPKDRELVPVDTIRLVQKWIDKMPAGHIAVEPGKKWPDIDAMNAECPKSEWSKDFNGQPQGPWQRTRITYFVDLDTMQKYTWAVNTTGADVCLTNFCDRVRMMRQFRGERVFAVVCLGDTFMSTRFGGRQRPDFIVKRWIKLGPSEPALPAPTAPSLPPAATVDPQSGIQTVEEPALSEKMGGDEVPYNDPLPESFGGSPMPAPKGSALSTHKPPAALQKPHVTKRGVQKIAAGRGR
jgi:hypothetical protein